MAKKLNYRKKKESFLRNFSLKISLGFFKKNYRNLYTKLKISVMNHNRIDVEFLHILNHESKPLNSHKIKSNYQDLEFKYVYARYRVYDSDNL